MRSLCLQERKKVRQIEAMSSQQVVSRAELYEKDGDTDMSEEKSEIEYPHEELKFVEITKPEETNNKSTNESQDNETFEYFPLFSTEGLSKINIEENAKVSDVIEAEIEEEIQEDAYPYEYVKQERSKDYYFSHYSTEEKKQLAEAAIDIDTLFKYSYPRTLYGKKDHYVVNVNSHNSIIDNDELRSKRLKRRRPSKNQRLGHKLGKQREQERIDLKQSLKKRFRKRGGKKNKKAKLNPLANAGAEIKV